MKVRIEERRFAMRATVLILAALPASRALALIPVTPGVERIVAELAAIEPRVARRRFASCHRQSVLQQLHDQCSEARAAADRSLAESSWAVPAWGDAQELGVTLAQNGAPRRACAPIAASADAYSHHGVNPSTSHPAHPAFPAGVDLSTWGTGTCKSVRDLLGELQGGEAKLVFPEGDGLGVHREINVVKVRITRQDTQERALVEARQVFADGRERSRGLPLSEKIKADEEPLAAARRGILEELRSALSYGSGGVHLRPDTLHTWEERRDSASYPSLPTYYKIHQVDAVVADLPDEGFSSIEYSDESTDASDSILVHIWEWRQTVDVFQS